MEWGGEECVGREEERGETEMPGLSYSAETEYGDSAEEAFSVPPSSPKSAVGVSAPQAPAASPAQAGSRAAAVTGRGTRLWWGE